MLGTGHGSPTRAPVVTCVAAPRARPSRRGSESRDFCLRGFIDFFRGCHSRTLLLISLILSARCLDQACRDPSATPRNLSSLPIKQ
eukprot:scaffold4807_cov151-Pinguiococcus_pyrenoidosus.AAC.1